MPVGSTLLAASSLPGLVVISFSHRPRDLRGGGRPFCCLAVLCNSAGGEGREGKGPRKNFTRVPAPPGALPSSCCCYGVPDPQSPRVPVPSKGLGALLASQGQRALALLHVQGKSLPTGAKPRSLVKGSPLLAPGLKPPGFNPRCLLPSLFPDFSVRARERQPPVLLGKKRRSWKCLSPAQPPTEPGSRDRSVWRCLEEAAVVRWTGTAG